MIKIKANLMNGGEITVVGKSAYFYPAETTWWIAVDGVNFSIPKGEVSSVEMKVEEK